MTSTVERIIDLIAKKKISAARMSSDLGFSSGLFSQWKSGKQVPSVEKLKKIAAYFHVSVDYLLGNSPYQNSEDEAIARMGAVQYEGEGVPIPIIGTVRAGFNGLAYEELEGYEYADVTNPDNYFYLRVTGDSMEPRIFEGDLVLVRKQPDVDDGDIAVVVYDWDCGTLKKVYKQNGAMILQSLNSKYPARVIAGDDLESARIIGKAMQIKAQL